MPGVTTPRRKKARPEAIGWGSVRQICKPPDRLTVSSWAERNRILEESNAEPGRWRNEKTPYLAGVMDSFNDPEVEVIVFVAGAQVGKTECGLNCLGYIIDQDPGTTLIVYPSELQANKVMSHRIHPMIRGSPAILRHIRGNSDDLGLKEISLDRMTIFSAWSNSPGALSSTPCRYIILDEVDKFPPYAGRESNPIKLAAVRTRTFVGRRKILIFSTPTLDTAYIWSEWERSDQCRYYVPCPFCGAFQVLDFFAGVKWQKDVAIARIRDERLAYYECQICGEHITDERKMGMVARGRWAPRGVKVNLEGELEGEAPSKRRRGFHVSALYSPFVSFGEIAVEFLESIGDFSKMQGFHNSWLGIPWKEKVDSISEEKIKGAKRDYPEGTVPAEARLLTAGADIQGDVIWYAIRAWGPGERSWLVRYGLVATWEDLWLAIASPYKTASGAILTVQRAYVDSGFRTDEVYEFCRLHRPVTWPSKGSNSAVLQTTFRISKPDPTGKVLLWTFKADFMKDKLSRLLSAKPGEPGEWAVHQEIDEEYVRQMTSERRVMKREKGKRYSTWEPITESAANHIFDCEVLNVLAAEVLGVRFFDRKDGPPDPAAPREARRERDHEGWLEEQGDWLDDGGSIWDG